MNIKRNPLIENGILILDGATGTNLQKRGLPSGVCPEAWILENPQVMKGLQQEYVEAGSRVIYAPTFTANRIKLKEYGLEDQIEEMNYALVALAREAAGGQAMVAGDMTMTGQQLAPMGMLSIEALFECYKEQAGILEKAGVDLFAVETMMSLQETRMAVLAIREVSDKPIMATLTFEENGRTLFGTDPVTALVGLQGLGISAFGINCGAGPAQIKPYMEKLMKYAQVPLIAKPNAGLPQFVDDQTVFPMGAEEFAGEMLKLMESGAVILGGCCGTTPDHIRALSSAVEASMVFIAGEDSEEAYMISSQKSLLLRAKNEALDICRALDASVNEELRADLADLEMDAVYDAMDEAEDEDADLILVNIDAVDGDHQAVIKALMTELSGTVIPLCFASNQMPLLEQMLFAYPGRAGILLESIDSECHDQAKELAMKYGAQIIA